MTGTDSRHVYGASTLKRDRRTKARIEQLDWQILAVLEEDHPQSVRHVFYRMTDPRLPEPVEKSDRGYRHVQARCVELRRRGTLPYGWISDASRRGYFTDTFSSGADFIRRMARHYRADPWADADTHVEVWVESRSIAGVVQADCAALAVSLYPCGGFSSISFVHEAATYVNECVRKDMTVLYIGDFDPAGVLIDKSLEAELRMHLDRDIGMTFERLAITEQQIADYDLPTKPRKLGDRRSMHVRSTVEAEAMPARELRRILRDAIESRLPPGALEEAKDDEDAERWWLERLAQIGEES